MLFHAQEQVLQIFYVNDLIVLVLRGDKKMVNTGA